MTVQNQPSGGFLKNKFNLGQNTKRLFQVLAKLPLTTAETELGYYHHRWSFRVAPLVTLTSFRGSFQENSGKSRKCTELKGSAQLATRNENFDNCSGKL